MTLYDFDRQYRERGCGLLCGVDEAGRGPLAGPVYAAAVILPPDFAAERLNDSKKVTPKRRETLYELIVEEALSFCVAMASAEEIDAYNILNASLLAMSRAITGLGLEPDLVLVDGRDCPDTPYPTEAVVGGDAKGACIAAASILAKVERDRYMLLLNQEYPQYEFARHKGYPTKLHYERLDQYGASPVHRESFLRKWRARP